MRVLLARPPAAAAEARVEQAMQEREAVRRDRLVLGGVLLLAVLLRFPLLTTIPVGLHYDEAWSGIDAAGVTWSHHPIFFTDSNGMEPLYLYLQTLSMLLFGHSAFALRLVSAVLGTLTVPALYLLASSIGGRRLGLLAAGILAVTYWHVHVSRVGYRAVALPLVECLAWWALWKGVAQRDWRWLAAGGGLVGLALYTYSTARVFPLAIALWFGWLAIARRRPRHLGELIGVGAAALAVFAPLGWYFLRHPEQFIERVGQVVVLSPGVTPAAAPPVLTGIVRTLGMFSIHGDPQWKYNLSGKPTFDPLLSLALYAGMAACLVIAARGLRRRPGGNGVLAGVLPGGDAAAALLLIWFAVMLVPGFITTDPPETLHTLAVVPVVCTIPAVGALLAWLVLLRRRPSLRRCGLSVAAVLILAEGAATAISYFLIWAPNPQTYYWLHGDVADLAARLRAAPAGATLYVAGEYYQHPTLRFLAPAAAARAVWFEAQRALPERPGHGPAVYAFAHGYAPLAAAQAALPASALTAAPRDRDGGLEYAVYSLPGPAALPPLAAPLDATQGDVVALLGATVEGPSAATPGVARVALRWRVLRRPAQRLSLFVHLLDGSGYRWAQADGQGFFSSDWQPGDEVISSEDVHLPIGTPPVPLRVSAAFYDVATDRPLPLHAPAGETAPDGGLFVGQMTPRPLPAAAGVPGILSSRQVGPGLRLLGAELPGGPVTAGDAVSVVLYLQRTAIGALGDPAVALSGVATADREPIPAADLLAGLPVGDVLAVRHLLTVSARAPTVQAAVLLRAGAAAPVDLGNMRIVALARDFAVPSPQHPLDVRFGSVAQLLGYDIANGDKGALQVTLYWQALAPSDIGYTVFLHLVGADGTLLGQHDGPPAAGRLPTTAWLPGQIIADVHTISGVPQASLPSATLQAGLYDAANGSRLPASGPVGEAGAGLAILRDLSP